MCKKKAPLVAEPFHRLIPLDLSGAAGNADCVAGGACCGARWGCGACGACGACGNLSVFFRLQWASLHPLSPKRRDS
jgi:hypothetical protein